MSIKSELNKTASLLQSTKKAIIGRGGNLSLNAGFKDLPEAIFNIPSNDSLTFLEVSEVSYEQTVPSDVGKNALISKVGGMTYKKISRNLCIADGVYDVNGLDEFTIDLGVLEAGEYYINVLGGITGAQEWLTPSSTEVTNSFNFTLSETASCEISIWSEYKVFQETGAQHLGGTITGIMLCPADEEDKSYEPYAPPRLVSAKPTSIESRSPNSAEPLGIIEIPEAVQNILGYGVGKSLDECNYIDFNRRVFVDEYEVVDGVVQRRENPIETDLTDLFPNIKHFLKVEGGGTIIFHNEHKDAVPSRIKYIRKVGI